MNTNLPQKGFIQIIIILVLVVVVISLLGISLKQIFGKLQENQTVGENFGIIYDWMAGVYQKYLDSAVGWIWNLMMEQLKQLPIFQGKK